MIWCDDSRSFQKLSLKSIAFLYHRTIGALYAIQIFDFLWFAWSWMGSNCGSSPSASGVEAYGCLW